MLIAKAEGHFVDKIEAQGVGQFVEARLTRIVRQAHIVDRRLLHHVHVLEGKGVRNDLHRHRVSGVGIDAAQLDGLSVELEDIAVDSDLTDTYLLGESLEGLTLLLHIHAQCI